MMQFSQSRHRDSWLAKFHTHANYWIQHPCGDHRDYARAVVHMDNTPRAAFFAISIANLPPVKWMPTIMNLYFLTDMGRMSGGSQSEDGTGCTWEARRPDPRSPPSSRWSKAAADSISPSASTWLMCSRGWPTALSSPSPSSPLPPTPPVRQNNLPDPTRARQPCPCPEAYVQSDRAKSLSLNVSN